LANLKVHPAADLFPLMSPELDKERISAEELLDVIKWIDEKLKSDDPGWRRLGYIFAKNLFLPKIRSD
jgi:hypothetical protein